MCRDGGGTIPSSAQCVSRAPGSAICTQSDNEGSCHTALCAAIPGEPVWHSWKEQEPHLDKQSVTNALSGAGTAHCQGWGCRCRQHIPCPTFHLCLYIQRSCSDSRQGEEICSSLTFCGPKQPDLSWLKPQRVFPTYIFLFYDHT